MTTRQNQSVERKRTISLFEAFYIRRSFAYAQDDATTNSGRGQAERAERSGLSVMLSGSETSYQSKTAPLGDPSLTLRMTIRYFFVAMTKKVTIIIKKIV